MGKFSKPMLMAASVLLISSCAFLGLKSVPWPTSVEIHNREAIDFYRHAPRANADLGRGLAAKPFFADNLLVGLAASGGGQRAAAYTLGVLSELQSIHGRGRSSALDQIDFISSNSGGSWGVAAYLTDRAAARRDDYSLQANQAEIIRGFRNASAGRVPCWASRFNEEVTDGRTFSQVYSAQNRVALPRAFFNTSLLPSQSPFVFSEPYLQYYQVTAFGACGGRDNPLPYRINEGHLADLPIGFAAATSGSVPGFYSSYAETSLCATTGGASHASFCHRNNGGPRNFLQFVDGGLYDNIGYKTAFEVFQSQMAEAPGSRRSLLIINSNYETQGQTVSRRDSQRNPALQVLWATGFPGQDASFERLYKPMFRSIGVSNIVLIDFFSTAGFSRDQLPLLDDLPELADFAAHNVACFDNDGRIIPYRRRSDRDRVVPVTDSRRDLERKDGDCLISNFYRAGTMAKTTYQADCFYFRMLWQLGQLSVRMNEARIRRAVF